MFTEHRRLRRGGVDRINEQIVKTRCVSVLGVAPRDQASHAARIKMVCHRQDLGAVHKAGDEVAGELQFDIRPDQ